MRINLTNPDHFTPAEASNTVWTDEIQRAIDQCHHAGGGTVEIQAGVFLTGMIVLRTGVELRLNAGAILRGTRNEADYPVLREKPFGEKPGVIRCLIHAEDASDITISGAGVIDGNFGEALDLAASNEQNFRPELIYFRSCQRVTIRDVQFRNSGFWCTHLMHCQGVRITGLTIRNPLDRINTDGIDPDGCRDVIISDCDIQAGDDCIVIKSSEGQPCENIVVTNCILRTNHGALKIGTEALAPIRNISMSNCLVPDLGSRKVSCSGIALYMKDGSRYENIAFRNILLENMPHLAVLIDNRPRYHKTDKPGTIRNISFSGLQITGPGRLFFEGREGHPIEGLQLAQISWNLDAYGTLHNKPMGSARTDHDPNLPHHLTNPYHIVMSHVRGASISDLQIIETRTGEAPDRSLFFLRDVANLSTSGIAASFDLGEHALLDQADCDKVDLRG